MRLSVETMTPAMAEEILVRSVKQRQRPLTQSRVRMLARAIQDDQFRVTHQPIAIDPDGILIDGQHRLAAISLAGLNVELLIAYDADPSTFDLIDTGRSRTPAATLAIAGYPNTNVLAAAARYYLVYKDLLGTTKAPSGEPRNKYTAHDILRLMETTTGELLQAALTAAHRTAGHLGRPGVITWLAASITLLDETKPDVGLRTEFLERLENGTMLEPGSSILALRRWITSDTGYARLARGYAGYSGMALFVKAWNYWLQGEQMQVAAFRVGVESTPRLLSNYERGVDGKIIDGNQLLGLDEPTAEAAEPDSEPAPKSKREKASTAA